MSVYCEDRRSLFSDDPLRVELPIKVSDGQGLTVAFPIEGFVNCSVLEPTVAGEGQNQCMGGCQT